MYTLLQNVGLRKGLAAEAPALILSMLIAETLYKFHSFTVECVAFLVTWFVASYLLSLSRHTLWPANHGNKI
jgi:hypothetical protein